MLHCKARSMQGGCSAADHGFATYAPHPQRVHEANRVIRGEGYVYTRELSEQVLGAWTEQAVLAPRAYQRADLFGHAMALYDSTVFITATNRDSFVSGVNSGAAFAFDLGMWLRAVIAALAYSLHAWLVGGLLQPF